MHSLLLMISLAVFLMLANCSGQSYPENMTKEERDEYYEAFNSSKTEAEWDSIRSARAQQQSIEVSAENDDTINSVSFSIKNNSLLRRKVKIADNILAFKPTETRYVGFLPGTKVYLLKGEEEVLLFEITSEDTGKTFKLFD